MKKINKRFELNHNLRTSTLSQNSKGPKRKKKTEEKNRVPKSKNKNLADKEDTEANEEGSFCNSIDGNEEYQQWVKLNHSLITPTLSEKDLNTRD